MPDEPTITIALVDDDPIVRSALGTYLSTASGMEIVHRCADGAEALDALAEREVDVVITDVRMPRMDGIATTAELRRRFPDVRILVITSFDEDEAVRGALEAGANGFLLKDTSPQGLVDAVRAVVQGTSVVSPGPITRLLHAPPRAMLTRAAPEIGLSPRELEILQLLCNAYSNTEIAQELYVTESTVKSHVSAIMAKLGVSSRLKAVVRAYELGLVERS